MEAEDEPTDCTTESSAATSEFVATAQRQQRDMQWVVPALSGTLVAVGAVMGEQQRPHQVLQGALHRHAA